MREGPGGDRLVAIRHLVQSEPDADWLMRPDVVAGLRAVRDAGLAYDVLTRPHRLPAAVMAVRAVPDMVFVLDHLSKSDIAAGRLEPWATHLAALAAEPNVVAKISDLVTEVGPQWTVERLRSYVGIALEVFGPRRLWDLSTWDKPAMPCLASRVRYGLAITPARLARAERAEVAVRAWLADAGITTWDLRVRDLGEVGRVELDPKLADRPEIRAGLAEMVRRAGFGGAELTGFRSGALNHE